MKMGFSTTTLSCGGGGGVFRPPESHNQKPMVLDRHGLIMLDSGFFEHPRPMVENSRVKTTRSS
jgi:hypothetical protein